MTRREDAEDGIVGTGHYPRPDDDDYKRRPVVPPADCISCGEERPQNECPLSKRPCGHHCNHSWSHDMCCNCEETFGCEPRDGGGE